MNSTIYQDDASRRLTSTRRVRGRKIVDGKVSMTAFATNLQWMAIAWSEDQLQGIVFGHASRRQAEASLMRLNQISRGSCHVLTSDALDEAPQWVRNLVGDLVRYSNGEVVDFLNVPIAQEHLTPFGRRVVAACRRIAWGRSSSYGELASKCGASGAARAVGSVMAKNRFPIVVPCHRVLGAGGKLGGYSAPGGLLTKRRLLAMESTRH
jgi:methylated-DNA-[protein]-cysteine S-methyltransferase